MRSQNDATNLLKRKRTKRQRSSSPQLIPMTASSSNGVVDGVATERGVVAEDHNSMSTSSAPTTSSGGEIYESTEEEEDMANCLIMLAQGGNIGNSNSIRKSVTEKINSRKLSTIISSEASKAGFYVYECKTCNRTFPSFQALGGHRASHKKPKSGADESKSVTVLPAREDYVTEPQFLFNNNNNNNNNKGCKIHECSICGSEFTSGQALGGHMRRHRAAVGAAVGNNPVVVATVESHHSVDGKEVKPRTILALDLNLPAPEDDHPPPPHHHHHHHHHHRHDPGFQFGSTQQALVFSAPALVDCHY